MIDKPKAEREAEFEKRYQGERQTRAAIKQLAEAAERVARQFEEALKPWAEAMAKARAEHERREAEYAEWKARREAKEAAR